MASKCLIGLIAAACGLAALTAPFPSRPAAGRPLCRHIGPPLDPDPRTAVHARRIRAKEEFTGRLLGGELTLFQTAALFARLNASPPGAEDAGVATIPGADDGERTCRQVLYWATAQMERHKVPTEAADRAAVLGRLERELAGHIAEHGGVRLDLDFEPDLAP